MCCSPINWRKSIISIKCNTIYENFMSKLYTKEILISFYGVIEEINFIACRPIELNFYLMPAHTNFRGNLHFDGLTQ